MTLQGWNYLGTQNLSFTNDREFTLPYTFSQPLVGIRASINQINAKQTWIRAGYLTQVFDTSFSPSTTSQSKLVRFEPQIIEFGLSGLYRIKFRTVPWVINVSLDIFSPVDDVSDRDQISNQDYLLGII